MYSGDRLHYEILVEGYACAVGLVSDAGASDFGLAYSLSFSTILAIQISELPRLSFASRIIARLLAVVSGSKMSRMAARELLRAVTEFC
jgi:hypothetical protein